MPCTTLWLEARNLLLCKFGYFFSDYHLGKNYNNKNVHLGKISPVRTLFRQNVQVPSDNKYRISSAKRVPLRKVKNNKEIYMCKEYGESVGGGGALKYEKLVANLLSGQVSGHPFHQSKLIKGGRILLLQFL